MKLFATSYFNNFPRFNSKEFYISFVIPRDREQKELQKTETTARSASPSVLFLF